MNDFGIQPVHVLYGLVSIAFIVVAFLWRILKTLGKTNRIMEKFMIEHEMLIQWYCKEHNIGLEDLATRTKGLVR